jgi:hypothetical protein
MGAVTDELPEDVASAVDTMVCMPHRAHSTLSVLRTPSGVGGVGSVGDSISRLDKERLLTRYGNTLRPNDII